MYGEGDPPLGAPHQQQPGQGGAPSPFIIPGLQPQIVLTAGGQPVLPPASAVPLAGAGSGSLDAAQAAMFPHYYSNLAGAGVSGALGSGGSAPAVYGASPLSLQDQQLLAGGGGGGAISLPLMQPGGGYAVAPPPPQQQAAAAAVRAPKARKPRTYKPPDQVQAEKAKTAEVKEYCRHLEQQLGRARAELLRLQQDNKALQTKAVVLSKHTSFRKCAAAMVEELTQTLTMGRPQGEWNAQATRGALDAAERGLPAPEVVAQLRNMSLADAVAFYNSVVAKVRGLLDRVAHGPDPEAAQAQLEEMFTMEASRASTFGYLQVVNPQVYAELMQAKLDPDSPVDRDNPGHWRGVLAAMQLGEEQEAQLILLLQSHLNQAEALVQRKSQLMQQLADELTSDLLQMELSGSTGSGELSAALSPAASSLGEVDSSLQPEGSSPRPLPVQEELERAVQLEYWLRFDFTGCVRKLLPPTQQALCMVASYPFYPDQKHLVAAIKDKAGQLWEQLRRA